MTGHGMDHPRPTGAGRGIQARLRRSRVRLAAAGSLSAFLAFHAVHAAVAVAAPAAFGFVCAVPH
jgi:hypothetical protein